MSAAASEPEVVGGKAARFSDRRWQATATAGVTLLGALAIALGAGPALLVAAVACVGVALGIARWHARRSPP